MDSVVGDAPLVIASIDTLKQPRRIQRLLGAARWDVLSLTRRTI